jgi:hypothetical protein
MLLVTPPSRKRTGRQTREVFLADVHTSEQRSFNMSRIRGKNIKPEMYVREFLHAQKK